MWEKEEDLENIKEAVVKFKERMNAEVRRQEKLYMAEERGFRRGELLGKYIVRVLYRQDDRKFEKKYLRKLERNWMKWKEKTLWEVNGSSRSKKLEGGVMSEL